MLLCTYVREEAVQICPESLFDRVSTTIERSGRSCNLLVTIDFTAAAVATAKSASSKTINGDFPPSSSATTLRFDLAAACKTSRPALVDPVKLIFLHERSCQIHKTIKREVPHVPDLHVG